MKKVSDALKLEMESIRTGMKSFEAERELAAKLTYPHLVGIDKIHSKMDDTVRQAVDKLVVNLLQYTFPTDQDWYKFKPMDEDENDDSKGDLELIQKKAQSYYNKMPLYTTLRASFLSYVVMGIGAIFVKYEEYEDCPTMKPVMPKDIAWRWNEFNEADIIVNDFKMIGRDAKKEYPELKSLPAFQTEKQDNDDVELTRLIKPRVKNSKKGGFKALTIYDDYIIHEEVLRYNPYIIWQWDYSPEDPYGLSPVKNNLRMIGMLNTVNDVVKRSTILRGIPPLFTTQGIDATRARKWNPLEVQYWKDPPQPLQFSGNMPSTYEDLKDLREQLRDALYYFNPPVTAPDGSGVTATAIRAAERAFFANISVSQFTLQRMLVEPLVHIITIILVEKGLLKDLALSTTLEIMMNDRPVEVEILTGITAEKKRVKAEKLLFALNSVLPLTELTPEARHIYKIEKIIVDISEWLGIDRSMMRVNQADRETELDRVNPQLQALAEAGGQLPLNPTETDIEI